MPRFQRLASSGAITTLFFLSLLPASASSANISRAYASDQSLQAGNLVSLDASRKDFIQLADTTNDKRLVGVVVAPNDSLLAIDATPGATQVATEGSVNALVSTANGNIAVGDQIAASPFRGLGMKAGSAVPVIGVARTSFNGSSAGATQQTVRDIHGSSHRIFVGYVHLDIALGTSSATVGSQQVTGLQRLAHNLTGHVVSQARVIIALVVAGIGIVALITLIYGSVYSSIISIGRNPLAKYEVLRTLGSVMSMILIISVITLLLLFLLLV